MSRLHYRPASAGFLILVLGLALAPVASASSSRGPSDATRAARYQAKPKNWVKADVPAADAVLKPPRFAGPALPRNLVGRKKLPRAARLSDSESHGKQAVSRASNGYQPAYPTVMTSCNPNVHSMQVNTSLYFDQNSFPNGGFVSDRYAMARVNANLERISDWYYYGWYGNGYIYPNVQIVRTGVMGSAYMVDASQLPPLTRSSGSGFWIVYGQVAVSPTGNGGWQYGDWSWARTNQNGPSALGLWDTYSSCWMSWVA